MTFIKFADIIFLWAEIPLVFSRAREQGTYFGSGFFMLDFSDNLDSFLSMSESEIAESIKHGNKQAFSFLMSKYKDTVSHYASVFRLSGCEREDLLQEGYIALYAAAMSFEDGRGASFDTYASLCIKRRMNNYATKASRSSHRCVSLDETYSDIVAGSDDILSAIEARNELTHLFNRASSELSSYEKRIFLLFAEGVKVSEIAKALGVPSKSVENAMARIRKKFRK